MNPLSQPTPSPRAFNWEEAKTRLARSAAAVADIDNLSDEQARTILETRARRLAQPPVQQPDASEVLDLVTFRLDGERFAIEARFVREMIHLQHVTPVPDVPDFLLGTTNLRGEVIAVLDVRSFFGVPRGSSQDSAPALVLGESHIEFALFTDHVEEVSLFRTTDFFDATGAISALGREWVRGITKTGVILLDAKTLLSDPRLFVDEV